MADQPLFLHDLAKSAHEAVINTGTFSENASAALRNKIDEYSKTLAGEADRTSKRHRADAISAADVEFAASSLVHCRGGLVSRLLGILGGVLLGASGSTFLSIAALPQPPTTSGVLLAGGT